MKIPGVAVLFLFQFTLSFGQTGVIASAVDSLKYLRADTLDCNADLYWRIVARGEKAIPYLIDKLTDTTPTNIRFHCKKGKLNVGEVAQFALTDIGYFPAYAVTKIQFDVIDNEGCWSFFEFFFVNSNKREYQDSMWSWYNRERPKYRSVKIPKNKQNGCQLKYGVDTYFLWEE